MDLSIPAAGMQSAGAAFDSIASSITKAFDKPQTTGASAGDSVDLSTQVASLLKSSEDFAANVQVAIVENAVNKSSFSVLG